jgi:hypothetical protein
LTELFEQTCVIMMVSKQVNCPDDAEIRVSPESISRKVGDETVILNKRTGDIFSLDVHSDRIWRIVREARTVGSVLMEIRRECDHPGADAEDDVRAFLISLEEAGIIRIERLKDAG